MNKVTILLSIYLAVFFDSKHLVSQAYVSPECEACMSNYSVSADNLDRLAAGGVLDCFHNSIPVDSYDSFMIAVEIVAGWNGVASMNLSHDVFNMLSNFTTCSDQILNQARESQNFLLENYQFCAARWC